MPLKLEPLPSPRGTNFEKLFVVRVPGRERAGTLALDAAFKKRERPWDVVCRLMTEANLSDEKTDVFMRALEELAGEGREGDRDPEATFEVETDPEESGALDQEEEELPQWAADPEARAKRWRAVDRFVRKRGAKDADVNELRKLWIGKFGELPRSALNGRMGVAGDRRIARRRRRAAMDRWPEAMRLDPTSALEVSYGMQPAARREPLSEGTVSRWGDVLERIGSA